MIAITEDTYNIKYVASPSDEMIRVVLNNDGFFIKDVKKPPLDMYMIVINSDPTCIAVIPEELRTRELEILAICNV